MNFAELRQAAIDDLGITDSEAAGLSDLTSRINTLLNEATRLAVLGAHTVVETVTLTMVAFQYRYSLPANCLAIYYVFDTSNEIKVQPSSVGGIDARRPRWADIVGGRADEYFGTWARTSELGWGSRAIVLLPIPSAAGTTVDVTYAKDIGATFLVADTDKPPLYRDHHRDLVNFAVARYHRPGASDERTIKRKFKKLRLFQRAVGVMRQEHQVALDRLSVTGPERYWGPDH